MMIFFVRCGFCMSRFVGFRISRFCMMTILLRLFACRSLFMFIVCVVILWLILICLSIVSVVILILMLLFMVIGGWIIGIW